MINAVQVTLYNLPTSYYLYSPGTLSRKTDANKNKYISRVKRFLCGDINLLRT